MRADLPRPSRALSDRRRARSLRNALLRWYDGAKRDLPWRKTRDPYAIWISETMLQQTRVETVIPYYERFLARFPDVHTLATADQDDVFGEWAGLGYYSRARNLQAAARAIVDLHGGDLPEDVEGLRSLPGIGRYTAGALASIAFDRCEALVDGNVARVLTRLLGIRDDVKSPAIQARLWDEAGLLVVGERPGDLNQALMELGATVCTPRSPSCDACPWKRRCDARRVGDAESLPVKPAKKQPRSMIAAAAWLRRPDSLEPLRSAPSTQSTESAESAESTGSALSVSSGPRGGRILAVRRPPGGLMGGLWELPGGECQRGEKPVDALQRSLRTTLGLELDRIDLVGSITHAFSHRSLRLHVFCCETRGRVQRHSAGYFDAHGWLTPAQLALRPHGAPTRKALALALLEGSE